MIDFINWCMAHGHVVYTFVSAFVCLGITAIIAARIEVVDDAETDLFADIDEWSNDCNATAENASTIPAEWDDLTI